MIALTIASTAYWYAFVFCRQGEQTSRFLGLHFRIQVHGKDDVDNPWRQCSLCAHQETGKAHRHREDGYLSYNEVTFLSNRAGGVMEKISRWFTAPEDKMTADSREKGQLVTIEERELRGQNS